MLKIEIILGNRRKKRENFLVPNGVLVLGSVDAIGVGVNSEFVRVPSQNAWLPTTTSRDKRI